MFLRLSLCLAVACALCLAAWLGGCAVSLPQFQPPQATPTPAGIPIQPTGSFGLDRDTSLTAQIPGQAQGYVYVPTVARRQAGTITVVIRTTPPLPGDTIPAGAIVIIMGEGVEIDPETGFFQITLDPSFTGDTVTVIIDFSSAPGFENAVLDPDSSILLVDYTGFREVRVDLSQVSGYEQVSQEFASLQSITLDASISNNSVDSAALDIYVSDTAGLSLEQVLSAGALQNGAPEVFRILHVPTIPVGQTEIRGVQLENVDRLLAEFDPQSDRQFSVYFVATPRIHEMQITQFTFRLSTSPPTLTPTPGPAPTATPLPTPTPTPLPTPTPTPSASMPIVIQGR